MVSTIFEYIGTVVTSFVGLLGDAVTGVSALFVTTSEGGAITGLTFLGELSLIAVGVGLVYFVWKLINSLIRQRRA